MIQQIQRMQDLGVKLGRSSTLGVRGSEGLGAGARYPELNHSHGADLKCQAVGCALGVANARLGQARYPSGSPFGVGWSTVTTAVSRTSSFASGTIIWEAFGNIGFQLDTYFWVDESGIAVAAAEDLVLSDGV